MNEGIKRFARASAVPLWAVADRLGISEPTMTRKLRHELQEAEKNQIISIIQELSREVH